MCVTASSKDLLAMICAEMSSQVSLGPESGEV